MRVSIQSNGGDVYDSFRLKEEFPDGGTTDEILDLQRPLIRLGLSIGYWEPSGNEGPRLVLKELPDSDWVGSRIENVVDAIADFCDRPAQTAPAASSRSRALC